MARVDDAFADEISDDWNKTMADFQRYDKLNANLEKSFELKQQGLYLMTQHFLQLAIA